MALELTPPTQRTRRTRLLGTDGDVALRLLPTVVPANERGAHRPDDPGEAPRSLRRAGRAERPSRSRVDRPLWSLDADVDEDEAEAAASSLDEGDEGPDEATARPQPGPTPVAVRLGRLAWIASVAVVVYCIAQIFPSLDLIAGAVLFGSLLLSVQGLFSVHLMLYAWEHRERLAQSCVPRSRSAPKLTFTVLLPARHAEAVIYEAIQRIVTARYPQTLIEVIVLCHADDRGTIAETVRAIESLRLTNVRLHTIDAGPLSTSHGLRLGSQQASNEIVTIFNANDDVDPDIFNVINAAMQRGDVNIVRSSVRLMRFRAGWFAMSEGLLSRSWLDRPTVGQRLLALWTLSYPFFHALASAIWPIAILTVFFPDLPVTVLALSSLPLLALIFQCTVSVIGTYAFAAAYGRGVPVTAPWAMAVTFRPYQWLRGRSAPRAVWCERRRQIAREETEHQTGCA